MPDGSITPSPQQLRALAHPARLRMLGILRTEGASTATALAQRLGLNTGATSYHLRQLAQHGFIVDDLERGNGRERWWRAAHASTRPEPETPGADPESKETIDAFLQSVVVVYAQTLQQMIEERPTLSQEWRNASDLSDYRFRLGPSQARRLIARLHDVLEEFETREGLPAPDEPDQPDDAVPYTVMFQAFPRPGGPWGGTS